MVWNLWKMIGGMGNGFVIGLGCSSTSKVEIIEILGRNVKLYNE